MGDVFPGKSRTLVPDQDFRVQGILLIGTVDCAAVCLFCAVFHQVHDCLHGPVQVRHDHHAALLRYLHRDVGCGKYFLQVVCGKDKQGVDIRFFFFQGQGSGINAGQEQQGLLQAGQAQELSLYLCQVVPE